MKFFNLLLLFMGCCWGVSAQQGFQFTHFNFDKLWFNPSYAGSHEAPSIQVFARQQWIGFEGAPRNQAISFHSPFFNRRAGIGLLLDRDELGPVESLNGTGSYSYRIPLQNGTLSAGAQASFNNFRVKYSSLTTVTSDALLPTENQNRISFNFGAGLFYKADKFFAGVSVPNFLRNEALISSDLPNNLNLPVNFYLTAGKLFEITNSLDIQPSFLLRYANNTPLDIDLHTSLIFMDKFYGGLSYRFGGNGLGESLDLVFQVRFLKGLKLGVVYDFTLSDLQNVHDGTVELMLQYLFIPKNSEYKQLTNPRFF